MSRAHNGNRARWNMQLNGGQFSTRNHKFHSSSRVYWIGINSAATQPKGSFSVFVAPRIVQSRHASVENIWLIGNKGNLQETWQKSDLKPSPSYIVHIAFVDDLDGDDSNPWLHLEHDAITGTSLLLRSDNCLHPSASFWIMESEVPSSAVFFLFFAVLILPPDYRDKKSRPSAA